jgi:hypothetical protein
MVVYSCSENSQDVAGEEFIYAFTRQPIPKEIDILTFDNILQLNFGSNYKNVFKIMQVFQSKSLCTYIQVD